MTIIDLPIFSSRALRSIGDRDEKRERERDAQTRRENQYYQLRVSASLRAARVRIICVVVKRSFSSPRYGARGDAMENTYIINVHGRNNYFVRLARLHRTKKKKTPMTRENNNHVEERQTHERWLARCLSPRARHFQNSQRPPRLRGNDSAGFAATREATFPGTRSSPNGLPEFLPNFSRPRLLTRAREEGEKRT